MRREEITVSRLVEQRKHTEAERKLCYPILCGHSFSSSAFFQSIIFSFSQIYGPLYCMTSLSRTMFIPQTLSRLHLFYALNQILFYSMREINLSSSVCAALSKHTSLGVHIRTFPLQEHCFAFHYSSVQMSLPVSESFPYFPAVLNCKFSLKSSLFSVLFPLCDTHTHS